MVVDRREEKSLAQEIHKYPRHDDLCFKAHGIFHQSRPWWPSVPFVDPPSGREAPSAC